MTNRPRYILALDQGTTSSRALVISPEGVVVSSAQQEFAQHYPKPGWVEHAPEDLWATQQETAREALRSARLDWRDLAGIGITNQRETTLVWDRKTGHPIHRAIVWQDRRTASTCDELRPRAEKQLRRKTGLVCDAYFSATKISWILDHVPRARRAAEQGRLAFGTVDSWLIWKMTGGRSHVTDATNASRTLLFDIHKGAWDASLAELFRVPLSMLPEVCNSSGICAETDPEFLGGPVPIAGLAGDQQAALFGQRAIRAGQAKNTYGTGCFLLMHTGESAVQPPKNLITTVACRRHGKLTYALEGSVFIAGAAVQWLRDGLGLVSSSSEIEALAASVPDRAGVVFVPALSGLGAPYWDPAARGTLLGITRGTTRAHIARATLEAIAHQTADVLEAMRSHSEISLRELRVDGGASHNNLLMQMQADLLGVKVRRPRITETTAMGAAMLAGLAVGLWKNDRALDDLWHEDRSFAPSRSAASRREGERMQWRKAVERSKGWAE